MKKFLAMLLTLVMVLSLVACGQKTPSGEGDGEGEGEGSAVPEGRFEVLMWSAAGGSVAAEIEAAAARFNEKQDKYWVTYTFQGNYTEVYTKLTTTINKKDLPALGIVSTELVGTYALTPGLIAPMSDYCKATDEVWAKLNGNLKAIWGNNGEPFCYPYGNSFYGSFVNADVFAAAGIDPYEALTSTKGIYEAMKKIVDGGYCEGGIGLDSWGGFVWYALAANGIMFMNNDNGRSGIPTEILIDTPEVSQALYDYMYYFRKMQEEGYMMTYGAVWGDEVLPAFGGGKIAVATGSIAASTRIINAMAEAPFNVAWVPHWSASDLGHAPDGYASSGTGFCIVDNGNKEAMQGAYEFICYTSEEENAVNLSMATGYLPLSEDIFLSDTYQDYVKNTFPAAEKAFYLQQNASPEAKHANALNPINNACQSASAELWSAVMADPTLDIKQAILDMDQKLQDELDLWLTTNT